MQGGETGEPAENLRKQVWTGNQKHIWRRDWESNPGPLVHSAGEESLRYLLPLLKNRLLQLWVLSCILFIQKSSSTFHTEQNCDRLKSNMSAAQKKKKKKKKTRWFSNHKSRLLSRSHIFAIIVILDLTPYLQKLERSLTPRWPLTPSLLRLHVWLYPRIIVTESNENTSKYVDTVTLISKTWTKGHWPLDDLWPHVCQGHMCDST